MEASIGGNKMTLPSPFPIIQAAVRIRPRIVEHLSDETLRVIKAAGYDGIRTVMHAAIESAIYTFLSGTGYAATYRDRMAAAVSQAYIETADAAYEDAGAELPLDEDTAAWARGQLDLQLGYVDDLFDQLKEIRKEGDFDADLTAAARADGYSRSLDAFYSEGKMRGGSNATLEFGGSDGKENCADCKRLKGKRHRVSYILSHDLVPYPGNKNFECQCYNCDHFWFNPKTGEEYRP
jgi:hypothetical protein